MQAESAIPNRTRSGWKAGAMLLLAALALMLYFRFDPAQTRFFPRCMFHEVSGWDCPGCGGQRAVHQLLHGNFLAALQANALLILLLPVAIWYGFRHYAQRWLGRQLPSPFAHARWPWVVCILFIVFAVIRNLPGFEWLRA